MPLDIQFVDRCREPERLVKRFDMTATADGWLIPEVRIAPRAQPLLISRFDAEVHNDPEKRGLSPEPVAQRIRAAFPSGGEIKPLKPLNRSKSLVGILIPAAGELPANFVGDLLDGLGVPKFAVTGTQRTYAAWPVWKDSTTAKVRFAPLPKKQATKLYHKARQFERQTRQKGKQDGALGRNGLAVLHALIFDFLDYATGQLDPAYANIARKACRSVRSVARGLANLKLAGVLNWLRRAAETRDEQGRFCLEQDTNAYAVLPSSQWLGFIDQPEAPPPHPRVHRQPAYAVRQHVPARQADERVAEVGGVR